jgi:DNA polymerase IIIc chi subunit
MDLFKTNGQLKARGKLLADLQDERTAAEYEAWKQTNDETLMEDVVIGQDDNGDDIVEQRQVNVFVPTVVTDEDLTTYLKTRYAECRRAEYPPESDYLDAIVKGDITAQKAYIDACLAVKAKYPK